MITPERLQQLLPAFAEEAKLFFYSYGLADLVIDLPIDHVAIKALDRKVYDEYIQIFRPLSKLMSSVVIDGRELTTAELYEPLDAGTFGKVRMLVLMEPKPEAIATTHDLIDHIELLVPSIDDIKTALKSKGVLFSEQSNALRKTQVTEINEWGQEVKFTELNSEDVANKKIA